MEERVKEVYTIFDQKRKAYDARQADLKDLENLLKKCKAGRIYVTAFPDFKEFKRHTSDVAWETDCGW